MEVTSLKLLEMENSISLDALLKSDNLSGGDEQIIDKNKIEYNYDKNVDKTDFNANDDKNGSDSSVIKIKKDTKREIKKEQKINEQGRLESITIEEIKYNWKNFIDKLDMKKPSLASVMDNSIPINLENGTVTIQIASSLKFHLSMIDKNADLVKNILIDEFKIELDFIIEKKFENDSDDDHKQDIVNGSKTQDDDQLRDKIVDLFDGEILT
tara:strand:- start:546 stop:1181 length:636 start_codon:yes stop_codon:yes gene_type:complete